MSRVCQKLRKESSPRAHAMGWVQEKLPRAKRSSGSDARATWRGSEDKTCAGEGPLSQHAVLAARNHFL